MADGTAVRVDGSPIAVPAPYQQENAIHLRLLNELKPILALKMPHPTGRHASVIRIVLKQGTLPIFVDGFRPGLKRGYLIRIRDVDQESIAIHRDGDTGIFHEYGRAGSSPITFFPGRRPQPYVTTGPAWSRLTRGFNR